MDIIAETVVGTVALGACVGVGVYALGDMIDAGFAFLEGDLRDKLRKMRIIVPHLKRYLVSWLMLTAMSAIAVAVAFGAPILAALLSLFLIGTPWLVVRRQAQRRMELIEDQMADSMVSLSGSIRAGLSLAQSIELLAQQCPHPINQEFQQFFGEYRMGKTLEQALEETKSRLKSDNFALFAAAMEASRRSGGKLNETVERIAHSLREMQRLERKIRADTSQARTSALYMSLAPPVVLAMYYFFVDPINTTRLFTTVIGQLILATSVLFNIIAYFWASYILNSEI